MRLIRSAFRLGVLPVAMMAFFSPGLAAARGFAVQDLAPFDPVLKKALGPGFAHRAEARRVTLMCSTCEGGRSWTFSWVGRPMAPKGACDRGKP